MDITFVGYFLVSIIYYKLKLTNLVDATLELALVPTRIRIGVHWVEALCNLTVASLTISTVGTV
jgi:hypothetical protein